MELATGSSDLAVAEGEMFFLIAKFLKNSKFEETGQALQRDLERNNFLPPRLDWTGQEHQQSFEELEKRLSHINRNHLLQIGLNLSKRLNDDPLLAPVVPGYSSLLGDGRQSLLRTVHKITGPRSLKEYCTRLHGAPLGDSLLRKNTHNIVNVLQGRQHAGPLQRRQAIPTSFYKNLTLQRQTLGHLAAVYCVLFDRSGKYIITGADDLLVKLWSAIDGRLLTTFRGASAEITDIAVNLENTMLAAGSLDRVLRVWDLQTGGVIAVFCEHSGMITSVNFCPNPKSDMKYLVTTSTDGSVAFWSYSQSRGQKPVFQPKPTQYHEKLRPGACQMICASFSPGGYFLAAGSADHHVRVYQMTEEGPKRILEIESHTGTVDSIQWAHSGLRFINGSKDGTALLWRFETQQWKSEKLNMSERLPTCPPHDPSFDPKKGYKVTMVSWDKSDEWVVTAVNDYTIKVWNAKTTKLHKVLRGHKDELYVLESHPKEPHVLLSAGHDGQLFLWDIFRGEELARFVNTIEGQGHGGIFDAKWSPDGTAIAATDSHGHILLYGFGSGHARLKEIPKELFFHTDYRPLIRDPNYYVLDEQTQIVPHLMPPPFLVDADGNPYRPSVQKLVPGRENCPGDQLIPDNINDGFEPEARSEIDILIEALANRQNNQNVAEPGSNESRDNRLLINQSPSSRSNLIREEEEGLGLKYINRMLVRPIKHAKLHQMKNQVYYTGIQELELYRREMKKRPLMIMTGNPNSSSMNGPPKRMQRGGRRRVHQVEQEHDDDHSGLPSYSSSTRNTTDSNNRTTMRRENQALNNPTGRPRRFRVIDEDDAENSTSETSNSSDSTAVEDDLDLSGSSSSDSDSSDYSDWIDGEDKQRLAPPKRSKRKPVERRSYSPAAAEANDANKKRIIKNNKNIKMIPNGEIPEEYRPSEWLTEVVPKKAPYYPQMGDEVVYFRQGHERYFESVRNRNQYPLNENSEPWFQLDLRDHEFCKVIGIKYEIKPPRLCRLKLALLDDDGHMTGRVFTIKYHDIPDVIDFIVLKQTFDTAISRNWGPGDRFRCMIDDKWWIGQITSHSALSADFPDSLFMCFKIKWDNNENESMSPWDMERVDEERLPESVGGSMPVLPSELKELLYRPALDEWPDNDRDGYCLRIISGIDQVMGLSVAEPFLTPVDLDAYPTYAYVVEYPIDLTTIRTRFQNHFYRRITSAQFDVRYLATNAEKFNERHSKIVKNARIITEIMLKVLRDEDVDVESTARTLSENYKSSSEDDVEAGPSTSRGRQSRPKSSSSRSKRIDYKTNDWRAQCRELVKHIWNQDDAEPFREPVDLLDHPDYIQVIDTPMDLNTVQEELFSGNYQSPQDFATDMRLIFQNSRHYNTNKQSRIYTMTLRLSEVFEDNIKPLLSSYKSSQKKKNQKDRGESPSRRKPSSRPKRNNGAGPSSSTQRRKSDDDDDDDDESGNDNNNRRNGIANGRSARRTQTTQSNGVSSSTKEARQQGRKTHEEEDETSVSESSSEESSDESSGIPISLLGKTNKYKRTSRKIKKPAAVSSSSQRKSARQTTSQNIETDDEENEENEEASDASADSEPKTSQRLSKRRPQKLHSSSDDEEPAENRGRKTSSRVTRRPKRYESDGPSRSRDSDYDKRRATCENARKKIKEWASVTTDEDDDDEDFLQKPQTSSSANKRKIERRRKPLPSDSGQSEPEKKSPKIQPTRKSTRKQPSQSQDDDEDEQSDPLDIPTINRPAASSSTPARHSSRFSNGAGTSSQQQQQQQAARTTRSSQVQNEPPPPPSAVATRATRSNILSRHQRNADELDRSTSIDNSQLSHTTQGNQLLRLRSASLRAAPSQASNLSFEALNGVRRTTRHREHHNYFEDENENENDNDPHEESPTTNHRTRSARKELHKNPLVSSDDSDDYSEEDKTPLKLMASSSSKKANQRSAKTNGAVQKLRRPLYSSDDQAGPSTSNGRSTTRHAKRSHDVSDDEKVRRTKRARRQVQSQSSDEEEATDEEEEDEEPSVSSRGRIIRNPKRLNY